MVELCVIVSVMLLFIFIDKVLIFFVVVCNCVYKVCNWFSVLCCCDLLMLVVGMVIRLCKCKFGMLLMVLMMLGNFVGKILDLVVFCFRFNWM